MKTKILFKGGLWGGSITHCDIQINFPFSDCAVMSENDLDRQSRQSTLFDLPMNVLQSVCQTLIDNLWTKIAWLFLRDVISLRSTCVFFRDMINDMVLYIRYQVYNVPFIECANEMESKDEEKLMSFLRFIQTETNWRFYSFEVLLQPWEPFYITPLFGQFETLFKNSIELVRLGVGEDNYEIINELIPCLETLALKPNVKFEVHFSKNIFDLSLPNLVSHAVFSPSLGYCTSVECGRAVRMLSRYTNLKILDLSDLELKIEFLKLFPCVKALRVGHLDVSIIPSGLALPSITSLVIKKQKDDNFELLPDVISKFFSDLNDFALHVRSASELKGDFCLPNCCYMLRTSLNLFNGFKNCSYLKFLSLTCDMDTCFYDLQYGSQLFISILKIHFFVENTEHWAILFLLVSLLITEWTSLEAICVYLDESMHVFDESIPPEVKPFNIATHYLFRGRKINRACDEFVEQIEDLLRVWSDSNVKLLILGDSVWMKKSTSSYLIKQTGLPLFMTKHD